MFKLLFRKKEYGSSLNSVAFQQQRRPHMNSRSHELQVPSVVNGFLDTAADSDSGCVSEPVPYTPTPRQQAVIDRRMKKRVSELRNARASAY